MGLRIDLVGRSFGRLTVIKELGRDKHYNIKWLCHCVCGKEVAVFGGGLKSGQHQSCGCLRNERTSERMKELKTIHGLKDHPLYVVWSNMKSRCYNSNAHNYKNYGGRGIAVCDRWKDSFQNFYNDVINGYHEHLQLDRIDNDGNYEPDNVRWVTPQQNQMNKRSYKNSSSNYKGVGWKKSSQKWSAYIRCNGVQKHLGYFDNEIDAAKAYNEKAIELFGEYANLNVLDADGEEENG